MADVSSLANKAYEAYSKGITGFSMEPLRRARKEKRDYEREQKDNIFKITADLDAQAYGSMSSMADDMMERIDSGELYFDSPEFLADLSKFRSTATELKAAQDLLRATQKQMYSDPNKLAYRYGEGEYKRAGGVPEFENALREMRDKKFDNPEDFLLEASKVLQGVAPRIDEQVVVPKIQKTISDISEPLFKTIAAVRAGGAPQEVKFGNSIVQITETSDISEFVPFIAKQVSQMYGDDFRQLAEQSSHALDEDFTPYRFGEDFVKETIAQTRTDRTIRTEPRPSGSGSRGGYGAANIRVRDVSRDVKEAIESADTMPIEKYVNSVGFQSQFDPEEEEFQFYTMKSVGGEIVQDKLFTFRADDADGIERFILDQNRKFLDPGASLDSSGRPTVDAQKAKLSQEAKRKEAEAKKAAEIKKDMGSISRAWVRGADWKDKRASVKAMVDKYGIEGVGYAKNTPRDYITIDGVEYSDPKKIEEKLMEKVTGEKEDPLGIF